MQRITQYLMDVARLSWRYLWSRPVAALLHILLLSVGLASITLLLLVGTQVERVFMRDLQGIDVVVGAKGSPLQLILAGVFHMDVPPGNIPLDEVLALEKNSAVAQLIPLSLGDSFAGARIVGTRHAYVQHYQAELAQGRMWQQPMEAVVGAEVAQQNQLQLGAQFVGSHGLTGGGHAHGETPYHVVGQLAACGCVLDRLILTATESVWQVHEKTLALDAHDAALLAEEREITLALIRYKTPLAAVSFPRFVNTTTSMQAAAPALEITRLIHMLGVGLDVLRGFGAMLLATAGMSVWLALWSAVRERQTDLALLRMLGAAPSKIAGLLVCEALWLALLASVLGVLAGHVLAQWIGILLQAQHSVTVTGWLWLSAEWWVPVSALGVAVLAALPPALQAYRVEVGRMFIRS